MATKTNIKVVLFQPTPEAERTCAAVAAQCMSPVRADEIFNQLTIQDIARKIKYCVKSGHLAVFNAAHTSVVVNVSRSTLTQLNTHAFIKTVAQSQQYVKHNNFKYHVPTVLLENEEAVERFDKAIQDMQELYNWYMERGYKGEDAREVLQNAVDVNVVLSGNFWAWINWINRRVCKRNTPQTIQLSLMILTLFREKWPLIFNWVGAPCEFGQCREMKPCGNPYPHKEVSAL